MKLLTVVAVSFILMGCTVRVDSWVLWNSAVVCADKGSVDYVSISGTRLAYAVCNDSSRHAIRSEES